MMIFLRTNLLLLLVGSCHFVAGFMPHSASTLRLPSLSSTTVPSTEQEETVKVSLPESSEVVGVQEEEEETVQVILPDDDDDDSQIVLELDANEPEMEEEESIKVSLQDSSQIAHLQKKLRYWKQAQKSKEDAYKHYCNVQMERKKLKPIYERKGKIDIYRQPPIYDQETDLIKSEIYTIKEQIKLTAAKLHEEERIQQIQQQADARMAMAEEFRQRAEQLDTELRESKAAQAQFRREYRQQTEQLKDALHEKETVLHKTEQLKDELHDKEIELHSLHLERTSLRALTKQSYNLLKTRVKKRFRLCKKKAAADQKVTTTTTNGSTETLPAVDMQADEEETKEKEMATVHP